jgi:eukaryotic-like serine/threonine-protein kinase
MIPQHHFRPARAAPVARRADQPASLGQCGPWKLLRLEANGPLTATYLAQPADGAGRPGAYALKLLHKHCEDSPAAVATLRREALAGRQLASPHLAPVLSAHVAAAPYFLVLPWLPGATLASRLSRRRLPGIGAALWYARQAAEGLAALHAAGWTHGDVKPANLLIGPTGHVTLLDLGFARRANEEDGAAIDRPVAGTPHYLPPEAITSTWADIRGDLYSLGVTLFEALCGQLPFAADSLPDLVRQHRQGPARSIRALAPHVPVEVDHLLRQLLAKQPMRRPQTPRELIDRLTRLEIAAFGQHVLADRVTT